MGPQEAPEGGTRPHQSPPGLRSPHTQAKQDQDGGTGTRAEGQLPTTVAWAVFLGGTEVREWEMGMSEGQKEWQG